MALTGPTPTSLSRTDPNRMGCGRSIDDVWARIDLRPDPHEQTCPDCQAARHDLGDLAVATHLVIAADKADPALRLDSSALIGILEIARAEVRRGRRIPMEQPSPGPVRDELTVSEQTLANLIRRTSDEIDGPADNSQQASESEAPAAPTEITVDLRIAVASTGAIPALTQLLRERVRTAVELEVGIAATTINITVEDIYDV